MINLVDYYQKHPGQLATCMGQCSAAFQAALENHHHGLTPEACDFYHTIETRDGIYRGDWDLRGHEDEYLGHQVFEGRRVVELGPASGWLSAYMARRAADLVVFDLPFGAGPELVPHPDADMDQVTESGIRSVTRLRNSWWFTKRALGFRATAVYGDIYNPPADIGRFDIAVFGAILLHLSNPFRALEQIAEITSETIVVTDVHSASVAAGMPTAVAFNPTPPPNGHVHWWALSPSVVVHMLALCGFTDAVVTHHTPERMSERPPMFTVVARRRAKLLSGTQRQSI